MRYSLSDCIAALRGVLGAPVSTDADAYGTKWGAASHADSARPFVYIGDGDGECVVIDLQPKGVLTQTRIYVAESIHDLAGIVVRGAWPKRGVVLPLADAVAAARIAMGRDRMDVGTVMGAIAEAFGFPTAAGNGYARWQREGQAIELYANTDGSVTLTFTDGARRVDHILAETTDSPAVIECRTMTDALYRSGACTLAVALKAAQSCLVNGLPTDAVIR